MKNQEQEQEPSHVIRGVVQRVTFRNPENGYSVLQIKVPDSVESITVVGNCISGEAAVGANVVATGVFRDHPKFGKQLSAKSITETLPSTSDGLMKYLGSGLIKGIGEKTAEKIVETFGAETMEVIYRHPDRLAGVAGVGKHKAELLSAAFSEQRDIREIMQFLIEHNVPNGLAKRIHDAYKERAVEVLTRDPYVLARQMRGVGFLTADTIAMNIGLKPDSPQRLTAGLYYALEKASEEGHCYLDRTHLATRARMLLGLADDYDLEPSLRTLLEEEAIVEFREGYFLRRLHRAEEFVASFLADRCQKLVSPDIDSATVEACLAQAQDELRVEFSFEQAEAVRSATRYPLLVITGGPGCGKTTVIKALSLVFRKAGKRLLLAAPTGRAAQRMAQVCEMESKTIHRLLKYDPNKGGFLHGANEPLIADAIVIDEASMIDIQLAKDLFSAIPRNAVLILVGDKDQLPSVGPGRVLGDIISLREVKTLSLSQLFRRSGESSINMIAHMINSGLVPEIPEPDGVTKADAYFMPKRDPEEAVVTIEKLVGDWIPRKFNIPANDIVVLTPSNRGPLGTEALNKRLQERLNPSGSVDEEQELTTNGVTFRVRDRVCQRVNNYQLDATGVFNGDAGEIVGINRKEHTITVELWDGRLITYTSSDIHQLSLAYALTVHRSQGSEIPCVVLGLHDSHYALLERQLIYTGVTRAKKLLVVVGSKRALAIASKRTSTKQRCTMLRERVIEALGESPLLLAN